MANTMIRPLRSEADYETALDAIERYFESEPKAGTPEADRFDLLALVIEDYERKRWPIEPPDAIDAIRYKMETGGHSQADLGRLLAARFRHLERKAVAYDEDGVEAQSRVRHPGRGAAGAAAARGTEVGSVSFATAPAA
jgi:antitoxin component HigA of HigAB toxin-antitoxin module